MPAFAETADEITIPEASPLDEAFAPDAGADGAGVPENNAPTEDWTLPSTSDEAPISEGPKSRSGATTNLAPVGTNPGLPGLGALPDYSFDTVTLTTDTVARTNLGNGNLLLTSNDGVLNGPSLAVRNDRFYNGLSTSFGSLGAGWSSPLSAADFGLSITSTTTTFRGPTGFTVTFTKSGSTWVGPGSFNGTLVDSGTDKVLTYNESGEKLTFNSSGWITSDTDRNGVGTSFAYTAGKVSQVTESSGRYYSIVWGSYGGHDLIDTITDSASRTTTYTHNSSGQLTKVSSPGGYWEEYDYDTSGRISQLRVVGTSGTTTGVVDFSYDTSSRVTGIKRGALGASGYLSTQTYVYTTGQTKVTDGNSHTTTYTIDTNTGRLLSAKDARGHTRSQNPDPNSGKPLTTTNAYGTGAGFQTTYTYDTLNNATSVKLPTGAAASAQYGSGATCGNTGGDPYQVRCMSDDAGNGKRYDYDTNGNLTAVSDSTSGGTGASPQSYTYASGGSGCWGPYGYPGDGFNGQKCSSTDGNGNQTKYHYDVHGNLTQVEPPAPMGSTFYGYDSLGRITSVTDGNNKTTTYAYNVRDEIVTTTFNSTGKVTTGWHNNGLRKYDNEGPDFSTGPIDLYYYNEVGWQTGETVKPSPTNSTYIYNFTYDLAGNMLSYEDNVNGKVQYVYNNTNQVIQLIEPGGTCPATGSPNPASSGCVLFSYDGAGNEYMRTLPGGATIATVRDAGGRATDINAKDSTGTGVWHVAYSYFANGGTATTDDRGNIQTRSSYLEEGITSKRVTTYTYDTLNRLKSAVEKAGATTTASWAYSYDNAGNRTQQIRAGSTGATAGTTNYAYNAANQLTQVNAGTSWSYDNAGNQLTNGATGQTATYNDRLAVTGIGSATYGSFLQGNGETFTRTDGSGTTAFMQSVLGQMNEKMPNGAQRAYERTPDGNIVGGRLASGTRYYYVLDSLGSVGGMFAADGSYYGGYTYSPYGETRAVGTNTAVSTTNHLRYIAGYYDTASGLYRLGARYYDPTIGRFTQMDPSGQETNPYAYASCNPVNGKDPNGLSTLDEACAGILAWGEAVGTFGAGVVAVGAAVTAISAFFLNPVGVFLGAGITGAGTAIAIVGGLAIAGAGVCYLADYLLDYDGY